MRWLRCLTPLVLVDGFNQRLQKVFRHLYLEELILITFDFRLLERGILEPPRGIVRTRRDVLV